MTSSEKIIELLSQRPMTAREICDVMVSQGFVWLAAGGPRNSVEITRDRVHNKLVAMLLKGQVTRKRTAGVWRWRLP